MREIKFRVWKTEFTRVGEHNIGEMAYDVVLANPVWNNADIRVNDILAKTHNLMQYTGLKDKNGKEIYEGDILKSESDFVLSVEYFSGRFNVVGFDRKLSDIHDLHYYIERLSLCEVIGNIYENPELLEVEDATTN